MLGLWDASSPAVKGLAFDSIPSRSACFRPCYWSCSAPCRSRFRGRLIAARRPAGATARSMPWVQKQQPAAVKSNNKEQIAEMIGYPLLVLSSVKRTRIAKKQAFLSNYSLIFTDPVRDAILHQTAQCLFGNATGAMVGNGEVWFVEQAPGQWKIVTINESATAP